MFFMFHVRNIFSFCFRFFILVSRCCFVLFLGFYLQINVARIDQNTFMMFPSNRAGLSAYSFTIVASCTRFVQLKVDRPVGKWLLQSVYDQCFLNKKVISQISII